MTVAVIIFCSLILIVFVIVFIRWRQLQPYNQAPLNIKTFDGLDSPFHPSVLYFPEGWNGWKYWMAETPFSPKCKPYVDRNECPSIHVSQDGIHWTEPKGLENPLVNFGKDGEKNLDYYSDPHLVMVGNKMECWYRLTERHGDVNLRDRITLRKIESADGTHWSDEIIISVLWENDADEGLGKMVVSPALHYEKGDGYKMWYVNSENHLGQRQVAFSTSPDGINWSKNIICHFNRFANPWHIDVFQDSKGRLLMVDYDQTDLILWDSKDGLNWNYVSKLLSPSNKIGSFYRNGLYRSCLMENKNGLFLYFSAYDFDNTRIGLAKFNEDRNQIKIISKKKQYHFIQYFFYSIRYESEHIGFILRNLLHKIFK